MNFKCTIAALAACLIFCVSNAQVGIGTTSPEPSSALDVSSSDKGLLAPRMTTTDRTGISNPAEGLLVYDTDVDAFFYYDTNTNSWVELLANNLKRDNYVLVKSVSDLPAPSGGVITLDENTYYEINGTIALTTPINLNNAYVSGLDASEDVLSSAGTVFSGSTGGSIRNITITGGGTAFNITGGASLLLQNSVISGMGSVGTISGVGLYFSNVVQFVGNTNGITYTSIGNLLLNNQGWLVNNSGTYETFTGTFGLVEKVSGFTTVANGAVGLNVSNNPIVANGVVQGTVFSRPSGGTGIFISRYTTQPNTAYNFDNNWTVNAPGIPREADDVSTGNIYFASAAITSITNNTARKLPVNTTATRLFRTTNGGVNNRITYVGSKSRNFVVNTTFSYTATGGSQFRFSVYKNGVAVPGADVLVNTLVTNQNQSVTILGTVDLSPTDYVEVYVQKTSADNEDFLVQSFSMLIN